MKKYTKSPISSKKDGKGKKKIRRIYNKKNTEDKTGRPFFCPHHYRSVLYNTARSASLL
jgi:hypothetical protein